MKILRNFSNFPPDFYGILIGKGAEFLRPVPCSPLRKSLPCARGGAGPQTGAGRVVICRSLTISQARLPMQVTIPRPVRRRNSNRAGGAPFLFTFHSSLFSLHSQRVEKGHPSKAGRGGRQRFVRSQRPEAERPGARAGGQGGTYERTPRRHRRYPPDPPPRPPQIGAVLPLRATYGRG